MFIQVESKLTNCSQKGISLGKFKCKIYVPIAPHYATQDFTNILTVGHEI